MGFKRPSFKVLRQGEVSNIEGMSAQSSLTLLSDLTTAITVSDTQTGSMSLCDPSGNSIRMPLHDNERGNIQIWNLQTGGCFSKFNLKPLNRDVYAYKDKALMITGDKHLEIWNVIDGSSVVHKNFIKMSAIISPKLGFLGSHQESGRWAIWGIEGNELSKVSEIVLPEGVPRKIFFSTNEKNVYGFYSTGFPQENCVRKIETTTVNIWNRENGSLEHSIELHAGWAHQVKINQERGVVMTWHSDGEIQIWELYGNGQSPVLTFAPGDMTRNLVVDSENWEFVATTAYKTPGIHFWSLETGELLEIVDFAEPMLMSSLTENSRCLAVIGWDKAFRVIGVQ